MTTKTELAKEILLRKLIDLEVVIIQKGKFEDFIETGKLTHDSSVEIIKLFKVFYDVKFEDELEVKNQEIKQLKEKFENENI